jgi:glucose dehydrogenase
VPAPGNLISALDAATGGVTWSVRAVPTEPVLGETEDGRIVAIDHATGDTAWQLPGVGTAPPWFTPDPIFALIFERL